MFTNVACLSLLLSLGQERKEGEMKTGSKKVQEGCRSDEGGRKDVERNDWRNEEKQKIGEKYMKKGGEERQNDKKKRGRGEKRK